MGKYYALEEYLTSSAQAELSLHFSEISRILGFALPESARKRPAWWSNNPNRHVQAQAWLGAGWETSRVDLGRERITFARRGAPARARRPRIEDIAGALQGVVRFVPGVDLTGPAWPGLAKYLDEKYGREPRRRRAGK
ncbi:MAG: DUF7662 domain-containing protein [Terriglobales bacterium]